jgi:hypothetical protein
MNRRAFFRNRQGQAGSARGQSLASAVILALLVLIAAAIFLKQSRFDEARFDALVMQAGQAGEDIQGASSPDISAIAPDGYSPMSETESFDRVSLSDKINGKADGYLEAGFVRLTCRRFMNDVRSDLWFEFYLYDMEVPRNAFSIYSKQKRDGVDDQEFTELAYATENAVFFATGKYYVEIVSAAQDSRLVSDIIRMSKNFIQAYSTDSVVLPEMAYLPSEGLDTGSVSLIPTDGFGYSGFDNIFTGTYDMDGTRVVGFVSIRETPGEANGLVAGYDAILSEFVGDERLSPETARIPGLVIVDLFGEYEFFFASGNILAGVHGAQDRAVGEKLAFNIYNQINGVAK